MKDIREKTGEVNEFINEINVGVLPRKSKTQTALLYFFLGGLGVHRMYVGKVGSGVAMLVLTLSFVGIIITFFWAWIDFIVILCGGFRDVYGRTLR